MSAGNRYPVRSDSELSPVEKESYEFLKVVLSRHPPPHDHLISPQGRVLGHFNTFSYLPGLVKPLFGTIASVYALSIPPNVREVALFAVCAHFHSPYQAFVHGTTAKHNGSTLTPEQLEVLGRGERPGDLKPEEAVAWDVVKELHGFEKLTDEMFEKAVALIGKEQTLNLIVYVGMSSFTAIVAKGADVGLPYGRAA
ncbi:hypothetical protein INS49_009541 [Diaporthe citri]|uniref:uncharacterized protein n=1 Tax=Diaporthe citri TaxID=83186 RepID=UPI001C81895B|nr:uncharacterized protein INS49_009541 [Diaporthe citri]KAG6361316.1 hypothetical protein INS49_009541 [Diaporthe citri]